MKPLAIDLYCGLGGWAEGLLAEGYYVAGFDIERHVYGEHRYPGQLVIQDVTTLHGSQFRDAALIVASPPCQEYSYMAMPWSRAKAKAAAIRADTTGQALADLNRLFNACFRIQREACEAAGRHIPMVVENVRGANEWVGRSRWAFGSYHLWGDVPALMPITFRVPEVPGFRFDGNGGSFQTAAVEGTKVGGIDFNGYGTPGYKADAFNGTAQKRIMDGMKLTNQKHGKFPPGGLAQGYLNEGTKQGGTWWHDEGSISRTTGSKSPARKFASAMIAKIPLPLSRHIGAVFRP